MKSKPDIISTGLPGLVFAGLVGAIAVGLVFDWSAVLSPTFTSGGDIPAHFVLMAELGKALEHGSIIHYSTRFWSGFELFQFYFPLPYLAGAILSAFIGPEIALKLLIVAPLLFLPFSFARLAQLFGAGFCGTVSAAVLGVTFLFTQAHVMWGGNIFSTFAGMIGNGWMFVFMPLALGEIVRAHRERRFSLRAAMLITLTGLCHFYGLFTLAIFVSVVFFEDAWRLAAGKLERRAALLFYSSFLVGGLLIAWWALPLPFSSAFSSEFGGGWRVNLMSTFEPLLLALAGAGLLVLLFALVRGTAKAEERMFIVCLPLSIAAFYLSDEIPLAVFTNIRLWPTIYFSLLIVIILAIIRLERSVPQPAAALLLLVPWLLRPDNAAIQKAIEWSRWNFTGVEKRAGWADLSEVLNVLRERPPARVSFESDDINNSVLGTVRMFEAIPFLTHHDIVEGGIVNSASFPGIPYTLQCLTSKNCAGWPRGSVVPGRDLERAVDLMRGMGVRYHIASSAESKSALEKVTGVRSLLRTERYELFEIGGDVSLVDVFDGPPAVIRAENTGVPLLSLPRVDRFRRAPFVFDDRLSPPIPAEWPRIEPKVFIDSYIREWQSGARVRDRSWESTDIAHPRRLNTFIHFPYRLDGLPLRFDTLPNFMVADRSFDPDVFYYLADRAAMTVFLPLLRDEPGKVLIEPHFVGWRAFLGAEELKEGAPVEISFEPEAGGLPHRTIRFTPAPSPHHPTIDIYTDDATLRTGFGTTDPLPLPENVTAKCNPRLELGFNRAELRTACPGRPHLLKLSYYPKWRAEVPIFRGTNGYMLVVPNGETLELRHEARPIDFAGWCLTALGVGISLLYLARYRRRVRP